ncbi:MAG TPA: aldo/keto reductase [Acidisarcina sp.]
MDLLHRSADRDSLLERSVERELIPAAAALGIGVTAWSPLKGGILSGKYHGGAKAVDGRMSSEMMQDFIPEKVRTEKTVEAVKSVSEQVNRSMAQVALAWLRYRPNPVIPILGARKVAQLKDNLASFELQLSIEHLKVLDEASAIELGFPHDFYNLEMVRGLIYGGMRDRILA